MKWHLFIKSHVCLLNWWLSHLTTWTQEVQVQHLHIFDKTVTHWKQKNMLATKKSKSYLSNILAILISPRPFLKLIRVVEAWARMCPPIGFLGSAWNLKNNIYIYIFQPKNSSRLSTMKMTAISYVIPAPGSAVIWLVTNTATLYSKRNVRPFLYLLKPPCDCAL